MQNKIISTYEEYCKLFHSDEDKNLAYILFYLQSWIINIDNIRVKDDTISFSLDQLLNRKLENFLLTEDFLSWIIKNSFESISFLSKHMKADILRENIKMPFYKAKEFNSQCFNWLSRQPGDNVKEKIINSSKNVLAVKRKMTFDTGENRLYISLLRELLIYEYSKMQNFNIHNISEYEHEAFELLQTIIKNPDYEEIGKWGNTLPNNTLLADKNYRQIWSTWGILKNIDKNIEHLSIHLYEKETISYYFDLLTLLSKYYKFPQCPVIYDVEKLDIQVLNPFTLFGVNQEGEKCHVSINSNKIFILCKQKKIMIVINENKILFEYGNEKIEFENNIGTRTKLLTIFRNRILCKQNEIPNIKYEVKHEESIYLDIYSVKPTYINDKNLIETVPGLLLTQNFSINNEEHFISCDSSKAIFSDVDTFSFINCIENAYSHELIFLTHLLEKYFTSNSTTIVIPDRFDVFQLSNVIKSVKLISKNVDTIPRSMGSVFYHASFDSKLSNKDVFIVVDYIDNDISFTLISGEINNTVCNNIQDYSGIVWSRHPTKVYSTKKYLFQYLENNNLSHLGKYLDIFGINDTKEILRNLPIIGNNDNTYLIDDKTYLTLSSFSIELDSYLNDFLLINEYLVKNKKLHIICLSHCIHYSGEIEFGYQSLRYILKGCNIYQSLQKDTTEQLWQDYLPSLSIKLLYGTFNLIKKASVLPKVNEIQSISISDTFTLTRGKEEYRFSLIQDDSNRSLRYAAIVRNQVFPLPKDVVCNLNLTYQYGSEQPFSLIFTPESKEDKKIFNEAKVEWIKLQDKDYISNLIPKVPSSKNWNTILNEPSIIELIENICSYKTVSLGNISNRNFGPLGNQTYQWNVEIDNKLVEIKIRENNWKFSKISDIDQISFTISENNKDRYTLKDKFNWKNKNEVYYTESIIEKDGENVKLFISQDNFIDNNKFSTKVNSISFSLSDMHKKNRIEIEDIRKLKWNENKNGIYTIYDVKIHDSLSSILIRLDEELNKINTNYISFEVIKPNRYEIEFNTFDKWFIDVNGFYFCKKILIIENKEIEVFFHQNQVLNDELFNFPLKKVSFDLVKRKESFIASNIYIINNNIDIEYSYVAIRIEYLKSYRAINIQTGEESKVLYKATNIVSGDKPRLRANEIKNILNGNKSIYDPNCPRDFREAIEKAIKLIFNDFEFAKEVKEKKNVLKIMSLLACDIGPSYYEFVINLLNAKRRELIIDDIGYSLGALYSPEQKMLFSELEKLPPYSFLRILSKAIWWNEDFIFNLDINWLLKCFENCIKQVAESINAIISYDDNNKCFENRIKQVAEQENVYTNKNLNILLEIILGTFRLRKLNNPKISKILSLANKNVVLLYEVIEKIIKKEIKIHSSLKLDIKDKGQYSEIPDLLYALLIYITGNEGDEGIVISSIIEDEEEETERGEDE